MTDFRVASSLSISRQFTAININSFQEACSYIKQLPYKRNADKADPACVLKDGFGTCSTKHALLKQLAEENSQDHVKLILGIFKMGKSNTPAVKSVLAQYGLEYIPEAHNYLYVNGSLIDCTKDGFGPDNFRNDLLGEIEIIPSQITAFKVKYHQDFLRGWLSKEQSIKFSFDEIWSIREKCIGVLSE